MSMNKCANCRQPGHYQTSCPEPRSRSWRKGRISAQANREYVAAYNAKRKAAGLCRTCPAKISEGETFCVVCRARKAAVLREYRKRQALAKLEPIFLDPVATEDNHA